MKKRKPKLGSFQISCLSPMHYQVEQRLKGGWSDLAFATSRSMAQSIMDRLELKHHRRSGAQQFTESKS